MDTRNLYDTLESVDPSARDPYDLFMAPHLFYVALCQTDHHNPRARREIEANTTSMIRMMDQAVIGYRPFHDIRLIVFPEFAWCAPIYSTTEELADKLAMPADNSEVARMAAAARRLNVYVQTGSFLEVDSRFPNLVFNTTLLIGPEGRVLSRYRKVNPWIPWEVHASPHDIPDYPDEVFPVVDTEIGRLGVATCYDWLFPEVTRELALRGCEVLIRISAYMDPWGSTGPMDWWTVINRARAIENTAYVVACNQGAAQNRYPPFSWPGGSMAVDYDGRILAQAAPGAGEQIVVAPLSVAVLREERARRQGHLMLAHRRSELYTASRQAGFAPVPTAEHTVDQLNHRISETSRKLGLRS